MRRRKRKKVKRYERVKRNIRERKGGYAFLRCINQGDNLLLIEAKVAVYRATEVHIRSKLGCTVITPWSEKEASARDGHSACA
jgi:hypothetical protein